MGARHVRDRVREEMTKRIYCATCKREGTVGEDDGWYAITVTDRHSSNGKYRYIGMFCSMICVQEAIPEMCRTEDEIRRKNDMLAWKPS